MSISDPTPEAKPLSAFAQELKAVVQSRQDAAAAVTRTAKAEQHAALVKLHAKLQLVYPRIKQWMLYAARNCETEYLFHTFDPKHRGLTNVDYHFDHLLRLEGGGDHSTLPVVALDENEAPPYTLHAADGADVGMVFPLQRDAGTEILCSMVAAEGLDAKLQVGKSRKTGKWHVIGIHVTF